MPPPEHFDVVVVGSGFGGSVTAYRLAEGGLRVCLLERGQAYPPGSFPRTPRGLKGSLWDPSEGLFGMYNLWSFKGIDALVSSGLGGGSLIYANVLLRKDETWFVKEDLQDGGYEYWPLTRADLEPHYDAAEQMLNGQRYPLEAAPYNQTAKTHALREAAGRLGYPWMLPKLAVTFANPGEDPVPGEPIVEAHPNLHGRTRYTCRLCGECDAGCNYGSKNTLDYNYLTAAQREGAELRTLCEVRTLKPRTGGGYTVGYVQHDLSHAGQKVRTGDLPVAEVTADRLILAAGTLGTNYLLLKNQAHLPGLSPRLGSRFCGNGDLLGFAFKCRQQSNGTSEPWRLDPNFGPVITSTLRGGDALDGEAGRGFYLQDAGYPAFMSWMVEATDVRSSLWRMIQFTYQLLRARLRRDTNLSAEVQTLLGDVASSTTLPLLGMGRDVPSGTFRMDGSRLSTDWSLKDSEAYFRRLKDTMQAVADAWGAERFIMNPSWLLKRVITVHPLGGCPMGRTEDEGVVDTNGEVFNHPGLYVADGAMMPGPVGANPALTIAALADRIAEGILTQRPAAS